MIGMYVVNHQVEKVDPMTHLQNVLNRLVILKERFPINIDELYLLLAPEYAVYHSIEDIPHTIINDIFTIPVTYKNTNYDEEDIIINEIRKQSITDYNYWKASWGVQVFKETLYHSSSISKFLFLDLPQDILNRFNKYDSTITVNDLIESGISWNNDTLEFEVRRN